jgi:hypothetical protein
VFYEWQKDGQPEVLNTLNHFKTFISLKNTVIYKTVNGPVLSYVSESRTVIKTDNININRNDFLETDGVLCPFKS